VPNPFRRAGRPERLDALPLFSDPDSLTVEAARDELRLRDNLGRVLALMLDMQWHSVGDMRRVGGSSGDRRLRELRAFGFRIEKERDPAAPEDSGVFRYRILPFDNVTLQHALSYTVPRADRPTKRRSA
jgi:hypothetical protein